MKITNIALRAFAAAAALAALAACGNKASNTDIGLVDVQRISQNWPKFQNYQNQLANDAATIEHSRKSDRDKQQAKDQLQARFAQAQTELSVDVTTAAKQVAADKHLTYVFTRQYVGFGGAQRSRWAEKAEE